MRESFGLAQSFESLNEIEEKNLRLHVGWGSFRNLDIIAARKSEWAILLDINIHQIYLWKCISNAISNASTPSEFINLATTAIPTQPPPRQFKTSTHEWLEMEFEQEHSWLYSHEPDRFEHIKRLFQEQRIFVYCIDMRGCPTDNKTLIFEDFGRKLKTLRAKGEIIPDTLYISNIPWMLAQPLGFFGESHPDYIDGSAVSVCRDNLSKICIQFNKIISAMRLAPSSSPSNLQWKTEIFSPDDFISNETWKELE